MTYWLIPVFLATSGCELFSVVSSPTQERGVTGFIADNALRTALNASLLCKGINGVEQVEFLIHRGRVLLMGIVSKPDIKQHVLKIARKVSGVKEVIDEMQVGHEELGDYAQDAWIGHRLRSVLFFDPTILSQNYHIRVCDRIVYILGTAQSQKELDAVVHHAEEFSVRRVVPYIAMATVEEKDTAHNKNVQTQRIPIQGKEASVNNEPRLVSP